MRGRTYILWIIVLVCLASTATTQQKCWSSRDAKAAACHTPPSHRAQCHSGAINDREVMGFITDADGLRPEFKADILLTLVESGAIRDGCLQRVLIEDAYFAADAAQLQYGERPYGANVEAVPSGLRALALLLTHFDRLSLQSRAVHDMEPLSPLRAMRMLEQVGPPHPGALHCDDNWLYDLRTFYATLSEVSGNGFTAKQVRDGRRLSFLFPYLTGLNSHAEVIPVAHALATMGLTANELRELLPAYGNAMLQLEPDGHTFAIIADSDGESLVEAMDKLLTALAEDGVSSSSFLQSLRAYLVQNFDRPRCDSGLRDDQKDRLPWAVASFNRTFDIALRQSGLGPIKLDELPMARVQPSNLFDAPPRLTEYDELVSSYQQLKASRDRVPKAGPQPPSSWWAELDDFLLRFDAWQAGFRAGGGLLSQEGSFLRGPDRSHSEDFPAAQNTRQLRRVPGTAFLPGCWCCRMVSSRQASALRCKDRRLYSRNSPVVCQFP